MSVRFDRIRTGNQLRAVLGKMTVGASLTVTAATNATPIVVTTSASHNLTTGDFVSVDSVGGNTAANGLRNVTVLSATTFSIDGSVGNGAYTSGGTARRISYGLTLSDLEAIEDAVNRTRLNAGSPSALVSDAAAFVNF